jgi:hypothetical protein
VSIQGRCHCGNIEFVLEWPADAIEIAARACDCSFCVKHGGVWTSNPDARLVVTCHDAALVSRYEFGTGTATFHVCSRCGAVPIVTSTIENHLYAVVNVNTFENVEPARIRASSAHFESEAIAARLLRRKRNWIANVELRVDGA